MSAGCAVLVSVNCGGAGRVACAPVVQRVTVIRDGIIWACGMLSEKHRWYGLLLIDAIIHDCWRLHCLPS